MKFLAIFFRLNLYLWSMHNLVFVRPSISHKTKEIFTQGISPKFNIIRMFALRQKISILTLYILKGNALINSGLKISVELSAEISTVHDNSSIHWMDRTNPYNLLFLENLFSLFTKTITLSFLRVLKKTTTRTTTTKQ